LRIAQNLCGKKHFCDGLNVPFSKCFFPTFGTMWNTYKDAETFV
jgi:hypothetical protein